MACVVGSLSLFLHLIGGCYPKYTNWIRKEMPCRSVSYPAMIQGVCEKVVGVTVMWCSGLRFRKQRLEAWEVSQGVCELVEPGLSNE